MSSLRLLGLVPFLTACLPAMVSAAPTPNPIIGCPSLANLRMLLRQTKSDMPAAAALLGSSGTDHLGCTVLAREAVTALQEHLTLNGNAYDCLTLRSTSVCHWVVAGAVNLSEAPPKVRGDKSRPTEKAAPEKAPAQEKARR